MSFEKLAYLAQIVASVGVIVSLIFVSLQIRQNTGALQRNEHNSTMAQWTVIRMAIAKHRDVAELMTDGLHGERALDAADQLRLEQMLQENLWASFHIWERTQRGIFPKGTFELAVGPHLSGLLRTERGGVWWGNAKGNGFIPAFVADVDAVLAKDNGASAVAKVGTARAKWKCWEWPLVPKLHLGMPLSRQLGCLRRTAALIGPSFPSCTWECRCPGQLGCLRHTAALTFSALV
jgi:hypothetical protein